MASVLGSIIPTVAAEAHPHPHSISHVSAKNKSIDMADLKKSRAERFGVPVVETPAEVAAPAKATEGSKKQSRAQRFGNAEPGVNVPAAGASNGAAAKSKPGETQGAAKKQKYTLEEMDKIRKRCKKFGNPLPPGVLSEEEALLQATRAAEEERLKAERLLRFAAPATTSPADTAAAAAAEPTESAESAESGTQ